MLNIICKKVLSNNTYHCLILTKTFSNKVFLIPWNNAVWMQWNEDNIMKPTVSPWMTRFPLIDFVLSNMQVRRRAIKQHLRISNMRSENLVLNSNSVFNHNFWKEKPFLIWVSLRKCDLTTAFFFVCLFYILCLSVWDFSSNWYVTFTYLAS